MCRECSADQCGKPGSRGKNQSIGGVSRAVGDNGDAVSGKVEKHDRLIAMDLGTVALRRVEMSADAGLGPQESGFRLEVSVFVVGDVEDGEASPDRAGVEHFMRDAVFARRRQRVGEEARYVQHSRVSTARNEQAAG